MLPSQLSTCRTVYMRSVDTQKYYDVCMEVELGVCGENVRSPLRLLTALQFNAMLLIQSGEMADASLE